MKAAEPSTGYSFLAQVLATGSAIEGFMHRLLDIIVRLFSLMNHSIRVRAAYVNLECFVTGNWIVMTDGYKGWEA
jgi:hypothetical protein